MITTNGFVMDVPPDRSEQHYKEGHIQEPIVLAWMKTLLRPGDTVIDGGANIGFHSLQMSRLVGSTGTVWSFEPDPENYIILQHNIARNHCSNVLAFQMALADKEGILPLWVGSSSSESNSFFNIGDFSPNAVNVRAVALDDLLPKNTRPTFIKLDIEGAEGLAISGARNVIRRCSTLYIIMELFPAAMRASGWDLLRTEALLRELGFREFYALESVDARREVSSLVDMINPDDTSRGVAPQMLLCVKKRGKVRMHIYPMGTPHGQDVGSGPQEFINTVPLSQKGIAQHIEVVDPQDADFFYMGQFHNQDVGSQGFRLERFPHLQACPEKHIADIEGDWDLASQRLDPIFLKCILTTSCQDRGTLPNAMIRPCCSRILAALLNRYEQYPFVPGRVGMGFRGGITHHWSRLLLMAYLMRNRIPAIFYPVMGGLGAVGTEPGSPMAKEYEMFMHQFGLALCPRGGGEHSVRPYEASFFSCIPIIVGHCGLLGEDHYDTSFAWYISHLSSECEFMAMFHSILTSPFEELVKRANAARLYFDKVVRDYFKDPTDYFIRWLVRHRHIKED